MTALLVALGAAVGAPLRFLAAHLLDGRWPTGTFLVNAAGSFLLGLFSALALDGQTLALLGTGLCGGLTTYSALAVQSHDRGRALGAAYAVTTVLIAVVLCAAGFAVGQA